MIKNTLNSGSNTDFLALIYFSGSILAVNKIDI